jgi:GntR family transcriptional regulator
MRNLTALFSISPSSGVPIYRQIMDQVRSLIQSGRWQVDSMVPSVRQMATDLEINAMTVSKAYTRLELDGVLERVRGTGMKVKRPASDGGGAGELGSLSSRREQLRPAAIAFIAQGTRIGLSVEQSLAVAEKVAKEIVDTSKKPKAAK